MHAPANLLPAFQEFGKLTQDLSDLPANLTCADNAE
jgi:hypothetical protein